MSWRAAAGGAGCAGDRVADGAVEPAASGCASTGNPGMAAVPGVAARLPSGVCAGTWA